MQARAKDQASDKLATTVEAAPKNASAKATSKATTEAMGQLTKAMLTNNTLKANAIVQANGFTPVQIIDAGLNAVSSTAVNAAVPTIMVLSVFTMMKTLTQRQQAQQRSQ